MKNSRFMSHSMAMDRELRMNRRKAITARMAACQSFAMRTQCTSTIEGTRAEMATRNASVPSELNCAARAIGGFAVWGEDPVSHPMTPDATREKRVQRRRVAMTAAWWARVGRGGGTGMWESNQ